MIDKDNHYIPDAPELQHVGGNTVGGNPDTFYPDLWAWLVKKLDIKYVLDVGCGEGHALREFFRLGCDVCGFDGAPRNIALCDGVGFVHDLTRGPCIVKEFKDVTFLPDLVWCCEVVGQIDNQYIDNVLKTLAQGKYLALTTELPNQPGHHHVNLHPPEFWWEKLLDYGMVLNVELTKESQKFGKAYWTRTGTIFQRY